MPHHAGQTAARINDEHSRQPQAPHGTSASSVPQRYPELSVRGTPWEMGLQQGEAAGALLREFADLAMERIHVQMKVPQDRIRSIIAESTKHVQSYAPDLLDELAGMARSSGVTADDLMLLQIRNQFTPDMGSEGCTSFSAGSRAFAEGRSVAGQNWDNDPALDRFTVVLTRHLRNGPSLLTLTQVGLTAYIGLSSTGMAVCLNSLPAPSRPSGVPHYFTVRRILESHSLDEAVQQVRSANRAIPASIMLASPQGPASLEVTTDDVHVLRDERSDLLTHTNHCLHPDLLHWNTQFPELIQSHPRKTRIDHLLRAESSVSLDQLKRALQDHDGYPQSLCRHQNEGPEHGHWKTVFSVIMDPSLRQMDVARGNPCSAPYETYRL